MALICLLTISFFTKKIHEYNKRDKKNQYRCDKFRYDGSLDLKTILETASKKKKSTIIMYRLHRTSFNNLKSTLIRDFYEVLLILKTPKFKEGENLNPIDVTKD